MKVKVDARRDKEAGRRISWLSEKIGEEISSLDTSRLESEWQGEARDTFLEHFNETMNKALETVTRLKTLGNQMAAYVEEIEQIDKQHFRQTRQVEQPQPISLETGSIISNFQTLSNKWLEGIKNTDMTYEEFNAKKLAYQIDYFSKDSNFLELLEKEKLSDEEHYILAATFLNLDTDDMKTFLEACKLQGGKSELLESLDMDRYNSGAVMSFREADDLSVKAFLDEEEKKAYVTLVESFFSRQHKNKLAWYEMMIGLSGLSPLVKSFYESQMDQCYKEAFNWVEENRAEFLELGTVEATLKLSDDAFVEIKEGTNTFYGGAQGWWLEDFGLKVRNDGGCGSVAADNILAYLAINHEGCENLYHGGDTFRGA